MPVVCHSICGIFFIAAYVDTNMKGHCQRFPVIFSAIAALLKQVSAPLKTTLKDIPHLHIAPFSLYRISVPLTGPQ